MEFEKMSSARLQKELDKIIDDWEKSGIVFSITDLLEINRILTIREVDEGWNS